MRKISFIVMICAAIVTAVAMLATPAAAQQAKAECTTLACPKCTSICKATCDAELKECQGKTNGRRCPYNFRSCLKACPSLLCAQCLPVQYGSGGKKFLPGKTELCRTPGRNEN